MALSLADLENESRIATLKTILVGFQSGQELSKIAKKNLLSWVDRGGLLIGCGLRGMDEVFGIKTLDTIQQIPDDYTIAGYFDLRPHPLTYEIHPLEYQEQKLLIFSDVQTGGTSGCDCAGRALR